MSSTLPPQKVTVQSFPLLVPPPQKKSQYRYKVPPTPTPKKHSTKPSISIPKFRVQSFPHPFPLQKSQYKVVKCMRLVNEHRKSSHDLVAVVIRQENKN